MKGLGRGGGEGVSEERGKKGRGREVRKTERERWCLRSLGGKADDVR